MIRRSVPELSGTPTRIARRLFVVSHECADGACLGGGNARRARERRRAVHLRTCGTCGQHASNGVLAVLLRRSPAVAVLRTDS